MARGDSAHALVLLIADPLRILAGALPLARAAGIRSSQTDSWAEI
jgi:hypothetical protein